MLEEFKNALPLLLLENPDKPIKQLGEENGWNNPQSWGVSANFLSAATRWQGHLGNDKMLFTLKLLEAIELPNPDDILLPLTGFRMWEGTHPVNPLRNILHNEADISEASRHLKAWASVWRTVDTPGTTRALKYVENSKWEPYTSYIRYAAGSSRDLTFKRLRQRFLLFSDFLPFPPEDAWLSAVAGGYAASMFPNVPEVAKYECIRSIFHLGFFPTMVRSVLRLHAGEEAIVVWEGNNW
jgi:hypothetical protein